DLAQEGGDRDVTGGGDFLKRRPEFGFESDASSVAGKDKGALLQGPQGFLRKLSRLTTFSAAPPASAVALASIGCSSADGSAAGWSVRSTSNCRPNCTEGSKKPLMAAKGIPRISRWPSKER